MLRLGEMLINAGRITSDQLNHALTEQKQTGEKLGQVLLRLGYLKDKNILNEFLAKQLNIGSIKLDDIQLDPDIVTLIPEKTARRLNIVATFKIGPILFVATADPRNMKLLDTLKFQTGYEIQPVVASESSILKAIDRYYHNGLGSISNLVEGLDEQVEVVEDSDEFTDLELQRAIEDKPLVKLVDHIILDAIRSGTSDIHIEPYENELRLRFRIDGTLIEKPPLPYRLKAAVASRIKIMSSLNISERRIPQDGRIKIKYQGRAIDFRVSIIPTVFGEKIVIRLLDPKNLMLNLTTLGFPERSLKLFEWAINLPFGMILVTGPTGSGKTTTLYSALSTLNKPGVNITTAEQPVEYNITDINQVQVQPEIGLTFQTVLRAFFRQDPDIMLIGEIRDKETAEIAIKAALTGHLVFSTLHTNDASSTITRLVDIGIPNFLIGEAVKLIMAQRLLKTICPRCKTEYQPTPEELEILELNPKEASQIRFYRGAGCPYCGGSGNRGRTAVFELMPITRSIKQLINTKKTAIEIQEASIQEGMQTLRMAAIDKLKEGIVCVEQVIAETIA
ncbi:Flp pilus assembly complex ATPase component TadA [bacterium]|nr:Flp pilus assembly complex ATPase component TadA [bacterium]